MFLRVGPVDVPGFGHDLSRVSGYTEPDHEVYARIFSPLQVEGHAAPHDLGQVGVEQRIVSPLGLEDLTGRTWLKWSAASASVGITLTATTHWDELLRASHKRGIDVGNLPRGTVDEATVEAMIRVLGRGTRSSDKAHFALWQGYAGEIDPRLEQESLPIPSNAKNYLFDGSFRLFTAELAWAGTRCEERRCHFPVAIWPQDKSFTLASTRYQDSYYLSSDRETLGLLQDAGLDALEISRDELLPSTGD